MEFTRRYMIVWAIFILVGIGIVVHLFLLISSDKHLQARQLIRMQINYNDTLSKSMGDILSHDHKLLRGDLITYNANFNLAVIDSATWVDNIDTLCSSFARILGEKSVADYKTSLTKARTEVLIDRKKRSNGKNVAIRHTNYKINTNPMYNLQRIQLVELPVMSKKWKNGGVRIAEVRTRRSAYPNLATFTLGTSNVFREGYGIEQSLIDSINSLEVFSVEKKLIKGGFVQGYSEMAHAEKLDIVTTLDIGMQDFAEHLLESQLLEHTELKWGCIVVVEVKTGEIRACANKERDENGRIIEKNNYALRERVAPGSTFKLLTFMTLMEQTGLTKENTFQTSEGRILTLQEIFEKSLLKETKDIFTHYFPTPKDEKQFLDRLKSVKIEKLKDFGIISNIHSEGKVLIRPFEQFRRGETFREMSVGYQVSLTPLQTLSIFNAVANSGKMIQPRFIKGFSKGDLEIKLEIPEINPLVCSEKTRSDLVSMLEGVVKRGTGRGAHSDKFTIAGKTGTAELMESRSERGIEKLISFAGFYPAENPKYSAIVVFRSVPTKNTTYAAEYAAPIFKQMAEASMSLTPINKDLYPSTKIMEYPTAKKSCVEILKHNYGNLNIPFQSNEPDGKWVKSHVYENQYIQTEPLDISSQSVPNVIGMGLSDALFVLENKNLKVVPQGFGNVISQRYENGKVYLQLN